MYIGLEVNNGGVVVLRRHWKTQQLWSDLWRSGVKAEPLGGVAHQGYQCYQIAARLVVEDRVKIRRRRAKKGVKKAKLSGLCRSMRNTEGEHPRLRGVMRLSMGRTSKEEKWKVFLLVLCQHQADCSFRAAHLPPYHLLIREMRLDRHLDVQYRSLAQLLAAISSFAHHLLVLLAVLCVVVVVALPTPNRMRLLKFNYKTNWKREPFFIWKQAPSPWFKSIRNVTPSQFDFKGSLFILNVS